jgi:hypothetical protein
MRVCKERFWGELLRVNQDFLFGCSAGGWDPEAEETDGIVVRHAYSIQKAVEIDEQRILHLKNPWGSVEWKGPWSKYSSATRRLLVTDKINQATDPRNGPQNCARS